VAFSIVTTSIVTGFYLYDIVNVGLSSIFACLMFTWWISGTLKALVSVITDFCLVLSFCAAHPR
jgi:hypothetical protein